jgi:hypothetical protein
MSTLATALSHVRITELARELAGHDNVKDNRCRAVWRSGDGWSVTLDDIKGTFFDHVEADGGGVLDFIRRFGHTKHEALRIVEEYTGSSLDRRPRVSKSAMNWARGVQRWREARINELGEHLSELDELKLATASAASDYVSMCAWQGALIAERDGLRKADAQQLVSEYESHSPGARRKTILRGEWWQTFVQRLYEEAA